MVKRKLYVLLLGATASFGCKTRAEQNIGSPLLGNETSAGMPEDPVQPAEHMKFFCEVQILQDSRAGMKAARAEFELTNTVLGVNASSLTWSFGTASFTNAFTNISLDTAFDFRAELLNSGFIPANFSLYFTQVKDPASVTPIYNVLIHQDIVNLDVDGQRFSSESKRTLSPDSVHWTSMTIRDKDVLRVYGFRCSTREYGYGR